MSRQRVREPAWSAPHPPTARHYLQPSHRHPLAAKGTEPIPKIVIFGRHQLLPPSGADIRVRPHAQVGPMHMDVRAVFVDHVALPKSPLHSGLVLAEVIDIDGPGNRFHAGVGQRQLIEQPILRYNAVRIGVREPALVQLAPAGC